MVRALIFFILLLLTGCSTIETRYVAAKCPEPPEVTRPELDIDYIKEGDDPGSVIQAHRVSIKKLQGYSIHLETILNGYRSKK